MKIIIYTDGGSRGNPGPAAIGAVLYNQDQKIVATISAYIGETTNNQAEYQALLAAVKKVHDFHPDEVVCYLDSELVVKQMNRIYKIKDLGLQKIYIQLLHEIKNIPSISFHHVPRAQNKEADRLVNQALDAREKKL